MENSKKLRFVCTRCGNCCTDRNTLVNVTFLDILRIIKNLKLKFSELFEIFGFYVYDIALTSTILEKMVITPIKTEKGLAFIGLMKNEQGFCYFYNQDKKKCMIYEIRPMFCKSFPFTFNLSANNDNIGKKEIEILYTEKAKSYCPGIGTDSPIVDLDHLIELAQNIFKELRENHIFNEKWNKKAGNNQIFPSAENFLKTIFEMKDN